MGRVLLVFFGVFVVGIVAGGAYLTAYDIPPPTHEVRETIDDSRFPR